MIMRASRVDGVLGKDDNPPAGGYTTSARD
jgi:hypothetical protein